MVAYYIRTADDECFHVDTLKEGLAHLTGENGYRLTISEGSTEVVIRRGEIGFILDPYIPTQSSAMCDVTLRNP